MNRLRCCSFVSLLDGHSREKPMETRLIPYKLIAGVAAGLLCLGSSAFAQGGTDAGTTKTDTHMQSGSGTSGSIANQSSAAGSRAPTTSAGTATGGPAGGKSGTE
jgi:hypothetical protein